MPSSQDLLQLITDNKPLIAISVGVVAAAGLVKAYSLKKAHDAEMSEYNKPINKIKRDIKDAQRWLQYDKAVIERIKQRFAEEFSFLAQQPHNNTAIRAHIEYNYSNHTYWLPVYKALLDEEISYLRTIDAYVLEYPKDPSIIDEVSITEQIDTLNQEILAFNNEVSSFINQLKQLRVLVINEPDYKEQVEKERQNKLQEEQLEIQQNQLQALERNNKLYQEILYENRRHRFSYIPQPIVIQQAINN